MAFDLRRLALAGTLAAAALGGLTSSASAATLANDGMGGLVYRAAPGEMNDVVIWAGNGNRLRITDSVAMTSTSGLCTPDGQYYDCAALPLRVELGDRDDDFGIVDYRAAGALTVLGGDGDDELIGDDEPKSKTFEGGAGNDIVNGYAGDDVLRGGPGNDNITGDEGNDELRGDDGEDLLKPDNGKAAGNDIVDGGAGIDTVNDWAELADRTPPQVTITQDGAANDGRPGERDNVVSVEKADMYVSGSFSLTEGDDDWHVFSNLDGKSSVVRGLGGNDRLIGEDFDETLDGGAGDDHVEGGRRNDTVIGGPGSDILIGDESDDGCTWAPEYCLVFGNDVLEARDGEVDQVFCGPGVDRAVVDAVDVVVGCETVEGAGAGGSGTGTGGSGGGTTTSGGTTTTTTRGGGGTGGGTGARLVLAKRVKLAAALRSGFTVRLTGVKAGRVTLTARRGGKLVAKGSARAGKAGTATVKLRFTKAAKRSLRRVKRLKLQVAGGGATTTVTLRR